MKRAIGATFEALIGYSIMLTALPFLVAKRALRSKNRGLRSLWAGAPIVTLPVKARAERLLGIDARTLVFETYFITDAFDYDMRRWISTPLKAVFGRPLILVWACWTFDRLHFFCDHGLLSQRTAREFNPFELRFYRWIRKETYFWTYGADVRTREKTLSLGEPNCCTFCPEPGKFCICETEKGEANQKRLRKYASRVFSMGDMVEYTPQSRNDLFFWPIDLAMADGKRYAPIFPALASDSPIRVVHAANHRYFKGTQYLIDAVEHLRSQGERVELVLVEKLSNEEALEIYRSADIIFDQCLIGFHGYFALEAMAMGKPVMAFIRKREYLLAAEECPIVSAASTDVEATLRRLVRDRALLNELGVRGRKYIETHFSVEAFSRRLGAATLPPRQGAAS